MAILNTPYGPGSMNPDLTWADVERMWGRLPGLPQGAASNIEKYAFPEEASSGADGGVARTGAARSSFPTPGRIGGQHTTNPLDPKPLGVRPVDQGTPTLPVDKWAYDPPSSIPRRPIPHYTPRGGWDQVRDPAMIMGTAPSDLPIPLYPETAPLDLGGREHLYRREVRKATEAALESRRNEKARIGMAGNLLEDILGPTLRDQERRRRGRKRAGVDEGAYKRELEDRARREKEYWDAREQREKESPEYKHRQKIKEEVAARRAEEQAGRDAIKERAREREEQEESVRKSRRKSDEILDDLGVPRTYEPLTPGEAQEEADKILEGISETIKRPRLTPEEIADLGGPRDPAYERNRRRDRAMTPEELRRAEDIRNIGPERQRQKFEEMEERHERERLGRYEKAGIDPDETEDERHTRWLKDTWGEDAKYLEPWEATRDYEGQANSIQVAKMMEIDRPFIEAMDKLKESIYPTAGAEEYVAPRPDGQVRRPIPSWVKVTERDFYEDPRTQELLRRWDDAREEGGFRRGFTLSEQREAEVRSRSQELHDRVPDRSLGGFLKHHLWTKQADWLRGIPGLEGMEGPTPEERTVYTPWGGNREDKIDDMYRRQEEEFWAPERRMPNPYAGVRP